MEGFVTDKEWITMLKYDIALNPDLASELCNIINQIDVNNFNSTDYDTLIKSLRNKCIELINKADSINDVLLKWYTYRHAYAYYGLVETITEGSVVTDKILNRFIEKYGDDYLNVLKKIDNIVPSELTNFSAIKSDDIDLNDENIKIYLLMKYYQDNQHVFHERDLIKKHREARVNFENVVRENYPHLSKISGKNLLMLVILDNIPIIDINLLSRFILVGEKKKLASIIGGKGMGLSVLNTYGYNIPETYFIPVTSLKNGLYKSELSNLKEQNYSVRSSATVEDNENNSFAGMFTTSLDVSKDNLQENIDIVNDSVNSQRVKSYVEYFKTDSPYMSIVIQKFKEPTLSGVWIGNSIDDGYLEYVNGNGEKLVSGHVKPISEKWPNNENNNLSVNNTAVGMRCLDLQKNINSPADLEWCILDDKLVWLQYRPVTKKSIVMKVHIAKILI